MTSVQSNHEDFFYDRLKHMSESSLPILSTKDFLSRLGTFDTFRLLGAVTVKNGSHVRLSTTYDAWTGTFGEAIYLGLIEKHHTDRVLPYRKGRKPVTKTVTRSRRNLIKGTEPYNLHWNLWYATNIGNMAEMTIRAFSNAEIMEARAFAGDDGYGAIPPQTLRSLVKEIQARFWKQHLSSDERAEVDFVRNVTR